MTKDEMQMLWVYASQRWPSFTIPTDERLLTIRAMAWMDTLADVPAEDIRAAMVALGDSEFIPPLGKLRENALELARRAAGEPVVPDVDTAWSEVMAAFHSVGRYATPEWSHPAIETTVRSIGWQEMCDSENIEVLRGQFARFYTSASTRFVRESNAPAPALMPYLSGVVKRAEDVIGIGAGGE